MFIIVLSIIYSILCSLKWFTLTFWVASLIAPSFIYRDYKDYDYRTVFVANLLLLGTFSFFLYGVSRGISIFITNSPVLTLPYPLFGLGLLVCFLFTTSYRPFMPSH